MAGFMSNRERFMIKMVPSYFSDLPTYRAIRMKIELESGQSKTFKYIEWMRFPRLNPIKYRLQSNDPNLAKRIANDNPRTLRRMEKAQQVEKELYNISDDPYELDNLLYYNPEKYSEISERMSKELRHQLMQ